MKVLGYLKNKESGVILEHVGFHESEDYLLRGLFSSHEPFRNHKYETEQEYVSVDQAEIDKIERQTCGRRMKDIGPWEQKENQDYWRVLENGDKTCSFCGSLSHEDILRLLKKHGRGILGFTDKSYKWYINQPEVGNAGEGGIKYYRQHDTPEFIEEVNKLIA